MYTWTGSESGTGSVLFGTPQNFSHPESSPPGLAYSVPTLGYDINSCTSTIPATIQGQVTITTTLTWVGDGLPPPKTPVYLKETANTTVYFGPNGSATADDGFGDPTPNPNDVVSSGSHLTQHDGSSGTITLIRTLTCSATGTVGNQSGPGNGTSGVGVMFNYSVAEDNRGVTLTRQGAHGETVDAEGNRHGDTLYSYYQSTYGGDFGQVITQNIINWQYFTANVVGSWLQYLDGTTYPLLSFTWTWTPNESQDTWNNGIWSMPDGQLAVDITPTGTTYTGSDSPQSQTITYTATSTTDGTQATATYYLTMHDPYETVTSQTANTYGTWTNFPGMPQVPNYSNQTVSSGQGYVEQSISVSFGVSIQPNITVGTFELGKLGLGANASFTYTINAGQTANPVQVPPNYYTILQYAGAYVEHTGTADVWDTGGPLGITSFDFLVPNGWGLRMMPPMAFNP
jgi:hypothetical protein